MLKNKCIFKKLFMIISFFIATTTSYAGTMITENTSGKIITSKAQINKLSSGTVTVTGHVENTDSTKRSFMIVTTFIDNNGDIIGTAEGAVNNLAPGQTRSYLAVGREIYPQCAKVEIQVEDPTNMI